MTQTVELKLVINNAHSLHMRPMQVFVETARKYSSGITVECDGKHFNAKSILELIEFAALTLKEPKGSNFSFVVLCTGDDAEQAAEALDKLVKNKFEPGA